MCFPTSAAKMRGPLEDSSPVMGLNIAEPRSRAQASERANLFLLLIEDIISARVNSLWDARQIQVPTSKLQGCNLWVAAVRG